MGWEIELADWAVRVKIPVAVKLDIASSGSGVSNDATWDFIGNTSGWLMVGASGWLSTCHFGAYHSFF